MTELYTQQPLPTHYGRSSLTRLSTCHIDLQTILEALAADGWDITVVCGVRNEIDQQKAYNTGKSKAQWPNSKHNVVPPKSDSDAVDIAPYLAGAGIPWEDDNAFIILAGAFIQKAQELGVSIRWGGLFKGLKDLGHFERHGA